MAFAAKTTVTIVPVPSRAVFAVETEMAPIRGVAVNAGATATYQPPALIVRV